MRFCQNCGSEVSEGVIFCVNCGTKYEQPAPSAYADTYDVFLSYRRDGGEAMAILLRDRLTAKGYKVFLDIENLNSGTFNNKLFDVIDRCGDFVLICSKDSLERCANDGDWVRMEIAHALQKNKNIVPVMLRGFAFPEVMPDDIQAVRMHNGINANSHEYFDAAIDRLADKFLISKPAAISAPPSRKSRKPLIFAVSGAAVLAVIICAAVVIFTKYGGGDNGYSPGYNEEEDEDRPAKKKTETETETKNETETKTEKNPAVNSQMVGDWIVTGASEDIFDDLSSNGIKSCGFEFGNDGKGYLAYLYNDGADENFNFSWTVSGDRLTVDYDGLGPEVWYISYDNEKLELKDETGKSFYVLEPVD